MAIDHLLNQPLNQNYLPLILKNNKNGKNWAVSPTEFKYDIYFYTSLLNNNIYVIYK